MNITLKPEARKFVENLISAGRYRSIDEVVQVAVDRMMIEADFELDENTVAAINRAEEQIDRGEGIDFDSFAAQMRDRSRP
jgi:putative addiction module CopG family antidote